MRSVPKRYSFTRRADIDMSELLHFSEHRLQEVSLLIMACVYSLRIAWLFHFKAGRERQAPTGQFRTNSRKGIMYSWFNIAMPWAMESTRTKAFFYAQFVIFHLGVVSAIGLSFVIPYAPQLLEFRALVSTLQLSIAAAFIVALMRIYRRISDRVMRAISSPDDYFSLVLLTVWFFFAMLAVPNQPEKGEAVLLIYFWLTAFFLIYVPFSKISHYLYYPFTRYYFGKTMGYRGVYPLQKESRRGKAEMKRSSLTWSPLTVKGPADDNVRQ
jgi:nitrate reductase gamma subunit